MRLITGLLCLVMLLVATACSGTDDTSDTSDATEEADVAEDGQDDADATETASDEDVEDESTAEEAADDATDAADPQGEELVVAFPLTIPSVDPAAVVGGDLFPVLTMMVEPLTTFDESGELVPNLATEWSANDDGTAFTFTLREGVTFHDGEPFNAEAVKFSLERLLSDDTVNASRVTLTNIAEVNVIDDLTVEITTSAPFGALPAALSLPNAGILSPASVTVEPNTPELVQNPVGTGPYMMEEWVEGDRLVMAANPDYWGEQPGYARQVYRTIPEASSRVALIQSGEADVASLPPAAQVPALEADPNVEVLFAPTSFVIQVWLDTVSEQQPLLQDPAVRNALNFAIDRQAILDQVLFGSGEVATGPLAPTVFGACPVADYTYDPDLAREMLAEAGAEGMTLRMIAPNGRYLQDYQVAEIVAGYLRDVGLTVELANPMDFATYVDTLYVPPAEATSDIRLIGFGASYGDASQALSAYISSNVPPDGFNGSYFQNEEYDQLYQQGNEAGDPEAREDAYCQAQEILAAQAPSLWLYVQYQPLVTSTDVEGIYGSNLWFVTKDAVPAG